MNKLETIKNLSEALAVAQFDIANPVKNAKSHRNTYADLASCLAVIKPVLVENGLAVAQFATSDESGRVGVETVLTHKSGEWMSNTIYISPDGLGGSGPAQAAGIAITYLRRYSISALFNISADDDTDGTPEAKPAKQAKKEEAPAKPTATWKAFQVDYVINNSAIDNVPHARNWLDLLLAHNFTPDSLEKRHLEALVPVYTALREKMGDKTKSADLMSAAIKQIKGE